MNYRKARTGNETKRTLALADEPTALNSRITETSTQIENRTDGVYRLASTTTYNASGTELNYATNNLNQYTEIIPSESSAFNPVYDADGNATLIQKDGNRFTYGYDITKKTSVKSSFPPVISARLLRENGKTPVPDVARERRINEEGISDCPRVNSRVVRYGFGRAVGTVVRTIARGKSHDIEKEKILGVY